MKPKPIRSRSSSLGSRTSSAPRAINTGPGRVLVGLYALFALSAGARAGVQIATQFDEAPLAYLLSALAAVIYLVATIGLVRGGRGGRRLAMVCCTIELIGVLAVGTASLVDPAAFPHATVGSLRTLAAAFGFPGDDTAKRCRLLSGGEKVRLVMARMLYDPPNFLVLDEPTNHLDLATKEMLIGALADYEGTLLLVSHDRRFLSALTNRVLELEADGPRVYPGGYAEYVVASGHEAPGMRGPT